MCTCHADIGPLYTDASCRVNPMYYDGFSSCTIVASLILFQGFNTTRTVSKYSLPSRWLCCYVSRRPSTQPLPQTREPALGENGHSALESGLMNPRMSVQGRMSLDGWNNIGITGRADGVAQHGWSEFPLSGAEHNIVSTHSRRGIRDAMALSELHEDEGDDDDDNDDDDVVEADERTRLRNIRPRPSRSPSSSPQALQGSARNSPRPI